jgi:hypothetical protein
MFDKYLCRWIKKEKIKLRDVLNLIGDKIFIVALFTVIPAYGIYWTYSIIKHYDWVYGAAEWRVIFLMLGLICDILTLFVIYYLVDEKLLNIQVAECPLKKE